MSRWLMAGVVGLSMAAACGAAELAQGSPRPRWESSYERAKALARESGKPMMVVFRCVP